MPFLAALGPLIGIGTAAGGATTAASVLGALGTLGGIAGAGTTLGEGIAGAMNGGPSAPPPPTAAQNVAAEVAKRQNEAQIVNRQIPGLVDQTGGGLSDQAYQTFGSTDAGAPGTFGQGGFNLDSIMSFLGGGNNGSPTDLMSLASGSITG